MTNEIRLRSVKCIEWTLQGPGVTISLLSKTFSFQDQKCHLEFYLQPYNSSSQLFFKSEKELQSSVYITARVMNASGETLPVQTKFVATKNQMIWSNSTQDLRDSLLTVKVILDVNLFTDDKYVQTPAYIGTRFSLEDTSKDFTKLLDDGYKHDVEFIFGDQTIKAHKSILCCRSEVFTSMLQSNMLEGKTGQVNIQDIDATVFRLFLQCLYTGMLPELTVNTAIQLYRASDKYAVNTIKVQCAEFLIDNISLENVCEILVLSDCHKDTRFKESVMEYVLKEKVPVAVEKWPDFCKEHQKLALEVYDSFCRYICQK